MSFFENKSEIARQLQVNLLTMTAKDESEAPQDYDVMRMTHMLSGVLVETCLLFDEPDNGLECSFDRLARMLGKDPLEGPVAEGGMTPAYMIDFESECGRALARTMFEDWLECVYEFHDLILYVIHYNITMWEQAGHERSEMFRLFIESAHRCLAYEIAAQELCDFVIDRKIGCDGWTLSDSLAGLSAVAGRRLALSLSTGQGGLFSDARHALDDLDHIAYVMTQEAIRLGVPAGSDWRFGLAANDVPVNPPVELIYSLDPYCRTFFLALGLSALEDQAVCCAKAAGRMIAVAAGGEIPEIEPVIAKPLAMAAMTETYKSVCMDRAIISC